MTLDKLVGSKYNLLTITGHSKTKYKIIASCECGVIKEYYLSNVKTGKSKSCGCLLIKTTKNRSEARLFPLIGKTFGHLTISVLLKCDNNRLRKAIAVCDCGVEKKYHLSNILSGKTKSCGCKNRLSASKRLNNYNKPRKAVSMAKGLSGHPLYKVYTGMIKRCYCENDISFCRYGAKGVSVCDEWKNDFIEFYNWALSNGWEEGLQIDKDIKGNGKLYSPETCVFVTRKINCRNRTTNRYIECDGHVRTIAEWAEVANLNQTCIIRRLGRGWPVDKALKTPAKNNGYHADLR